MPVACLGSCGSGKSRYLQTRVASCLRDPAWGGARFVVLDVSGVGLSTLGDWPGSAARGAPQLTICRVTTPEQAAAALERGERYVIVRPRPEDAAAEPLPPWASVADELARTVAAAGRCVLVLPEAQMSAPEGRPAPHHLSALVHAYRHVRCDLWIDTQQAAYVRKEVLTACTEVRWFACTFRDHQACGQLYGPAARAVVEEASRRGAGAPGWHARIDARVGAATLVDPKGRVAA